MFLVISVLESTGSTSVLNGIKASRASPAVITACIPLQLTLSSIGQLTHSLTSFGTKPQIAPLVLTRSSPEQVLTHVVDAGLAAKNQHSLFVSASRNIPGPLKSVIP